MTKCLRRRENALLHFETISMIALAALTAIWVWYLAYGAMRLLVLV